MSGKLSKKIFFKNTDKSFGLIARGFHWTTALIVLALLSLGLYMAGLEYSPFKLNLYFWHKSFGILVLMLLTLRLGWRLYNGPPSPLASHEKWEKALSQKIHVLLYFGLAVMPLSGWFMSSAGDFPASFFGLFDMPDLVAKNETVFKILRRVHTFSAYALIAAIGLHALGAVKHHLIDKDETLRRMGGNTYIIPAAVILLLIPVILIAKDFVPSLFALPAAQEEEETEVTADNILIKIPEEGPVEVSAQVPGDFPAWTILSGQSHIKFEATQYGEVFEGEFGDFKGEIHFDPDNLEQARADITIDIGSIKTGSDDRDGQAKEADWFDTTAFPSAFFQARNFENGENGYIAKGYLTIHGITIPTELPFTLDIQGGEDGLQTATMQGRLSLNRLDFKIGRGEWEATDTIGGEVKINLHVRAVSSGSLPSLLP